MNHRTSPDVLLLQLEFPTWAQARAWTYPACFGVGEGLRAAGATCTTLPLFANTSLSPERWLEQTRAAVDGQRFDQVWVWLVHSPLNASILEWISGLAPVRVGIVMESLTYDEADYAWAGHLRARMQTVAEQSRAFTHVLVPDERDVEPLAQRAGVQSLWWPTMVPERFIVPATSEPRVSTGVFHGHPYGPRRAWIENERVLAHMTFVGSGAPPTRYQIWFDQLQTSAITRWAATAAMTARQMAGYMAMLQEVREGEFREWMAQLPQWAAIVNLPSLAKFYGGRVYEGMAAGRPVLTYHVPDHPFNNSLFVEGEEVLCFAPDDPDSLSACLERVLHDRTLAHRIAANAQRKMRRYHTCERRLADTLRWIESGERPEYGLAQSVELKVEAFSIPQTVGAIAQRVLTSRLDVGQPTITSAAVRPPYTAPEGSMESDRFYVNLFINAPAWSTPHPNADEAARWSKIASFLECILRQVRQDSPGKVLRILDVGCGRGWLTNLVSMYGHCEGVEPVSEVVAHARRLFPHLRFEAGTADEILARPDFSPYDVVVTSEVLEHVPHGQKDLFLAQLALLLTPEGYLVLTTPRGEMWEQWKTIAPPNQPVEDWVTEGDVQKLFRRQGFAVLGLERVHVEVPGLRYVPAPTPAELESMNLLPIYQVWACQRVGQSRPATFLRRPKVSVIVPTYNRPDRLKEALQSILRQTCQDFEIVVVNDGGFDVAATVAALNDGRITYIQHDRNRGLAASRNTGLTAASGTYIAYLDDDDRYLPNHLETLVTVLEQGEYKVAYSDAWRVHEQLSDDRHVEIGRDVAYSYDFNPAHLLIFNYFPVLCVMHRRDCLEKVGRFDESLYAHEDWDLWIRMATVFPFKHVPCTTAEYSWRTDGSSMTSATQETYWRTTEIIYRKYRPHAEQIDGMLGAQQQRLQKLRLARIERTRVCSIIMPVCNRVELTRDCLTTLATLNGLPDYELIVIDNGSTDGTAEFLAQLGGDVRIVTNTENVGFAKACNQGAALARGKYLVFLNNDTIPRPGWLEALVWEVEQDQEIAVVGSKLLYGDGTTQHAGVVFSRTSGIPYHLYRRLPGESPAVNRRREFQCVTAACMLVRRESFEKVGGFNEAYRNGFEDVDLCLKIREQGYRIVYQPRSVVIHLEEQTPGRKTHDADNMRLFLSRWEKHWWLADEDLHYHADGFKMVGSEATGKYVGHVQLIEEIRDRAAWAHVAATQTAALKQDWPSVRRELALVNDWPDDPYVLSWGATVAERLQEPVYRAQFLARYVALVDEPVKRLELIRMFLEQHNLSGAEEHLASLLRVSPDHGEGLLLKGILCMQREQYAQAEAAFGSALHAGVERRKCLMGMGMAAMGRAYTQGAWERFLEVLVEHPDDPEAIHWLLRAGTAQNRWQELGEHLHLYTARNPGDLAARFAFTSVLLRGEQIEAARREYDALCKLDPQYDGLGQLGQAIGGREAALAMEAASS